MSRFSLQPTNNSVMTPQWRKKRAIAQAEETIEVLKADIAKYTSDAARLTKQIAGHDADIAAWTGDEKAATKVRHLEKSDYDTLHTDYSESVDALQRAILVMKKQSHDRPQAAAFAQLSALQKIPLVPQHAKAAINLFLQRAILVMKKQSHDRPQAA